ncbi:hypothetical protein OKW42_004429 [Paraburkholderia sp. WC7.3d]
MTAPSPVPEAIHPSLWRASQLARGRGRTVDAGYPALSAELPGGGWPIGALIDLLVQQAGVGEMRSLRPALSTRGKRPVAVVQPPHVPNGLGLEYIGLSSEQLLIRATKTADALWSAEQILRAGSCGALLFWTQYAPVPHMSSARSVAPCASKRCDRRRLPSRPGLFDLARLAGHSPPFQFCTGPFELLRD